MHFALQVIECFERVQQQLVSVEPKLQPCLLEPVTAHMTILVLHIQTEVRKADQCRFSLFVLLIQQST